ncbi:MAG: ATP-binding protein [Bacteroidota bacterium]|nr:ATP-binding protein [Bacteroidota bacterium]
MKFLSNIQPRYIIAITISIAVLMFTSAYVELQQSKEELFHLLEEHSISLAEIVQRSSSNIVLSSDYIEQQLAERLYNNASFIARMDSAKKLKQSDLARVANKNGIFRIHIFESKGKRIASSHIPLGYGAAMHDQNISSPVFAPILRGELDQMTIGFKESRFMDGKRFAVAVKRTGRNHGAIVLTLDAKEIVEFRKNIGIGRLINDLSNNSGIEYVVLQDSLGIIAATQGITEMSRIDDDQVLLRVLTNDSSITRRSLFHDREVFEVIRALTIEQSVVGLLRIGISMDEIRSVESRMWRRMFIMSIVLISIGAVIFTAIIANQNFQLMSKKYERVQQFTENILHSMQDIVITFDDQQRISIFNQQAELFFRISAENVLGKSIEELPDGLRNSIRNISTVQNKDTNEQLVVNGNEFILSISVSETLKKDGSIESRTILIKDLTESKRLEREVQRKEKMTAMGELAAGVAHEIRNPLNAISMIAQRFEKEFLPKKGLKEYKELNSVLKNESIRVNGIIQQFLSFARSKKIKPSIISSLMLINHLSMLFQSQAKERKIYFTSHSEDIPISIDFEQMTQALLNLLQNALDATSEDGSIVLTLAKINNEIKIEIADIGTGIETELQEKIFDLYFTTKLNGTGMGLAITQQIISQHNGSITVRNNKPQGSIFLITLPV